MKQAELKYGLIAGISTIGWFLLFYFIDKAWMLSPWVYYASFGFYLWAMYKAMGLLSANVVARQIAFKEVVRVGFVVYLVANALYYFFYYLIHKMDPALADIQKEMMREWLPRITPRDKLQKALEALENGDFSISSGTAFFSYVRSAIGGFALAVVLAWVSIRTARQ